MFFLGLFLVLRGPSAADQKHVSNLDVTALGLRSDVDALVLSTGYKLFVGDGMAVVAVVPFALLLRIAPVVEENAAACDTVLGEVVDRGFQVR